MTEADGVADFVRDERRVRSGADARPDDDVSVTDADKRFALEGVREVSGAERTGHDAVADADVRSRISEIDDVDAVVRVRSRGGRRSRVGEHDEGGRIVGPCRRSGRDAAGTVDGGEAAAGPELETASRLAVLNANRKAASTAGGE